MNKKSFMNAPDSLSIDNYLKKLLPIGLAFPPGTCFDATCYHDNWCGIYDGRHCNCDPDVVIVLLDL